jgi:alpha-galactosidase
MKNPFRFQFALLLLGLTLRAGAAPATTDELSACRLWSERTFRAAADEVSTPCLILVSEDVADSVSRGRSWRGTPFQLGTRTYTHGLAFNANKRIQARLGRPGKRFVAEVGLENNDDTQRGEAAGNGSVTFHVFVAGREVFQTPVLRRKDGARPLEVALEGAREFEIEVRDGGDGRGWDQALWAEAVVTLADDTTVRLQDIPWRAAAGANPYGFSFQYQGTNSASLLGQWTSRASEQQLDSGRVRGVVIFRDAATGLEARVETIRFHDFPAVEWMVTLTNTSAANTPLIENLQAFDGVLPLASSGPPLLHWARGAVASFDDFAPVDVRLQPGAKLRLQPGGGRSSSQVLPFFNLEGANGGIVAAIGWSGEWAAEFLSDQAGQTVLRAGMARTRLVLHPGEGIRSPRMLFLFYEGDRWRGQNLLRQFLLAHHRPKVSGKPMVAPVTCGNWGATRAEVHLDNIQKIIQHRLPVDYYWIDAEWFGRGGWPNNVGSWELKRDLYPSGFKPLSTALRQANRELMLWFEPERVYRDTTWHREHPEWLLHVSGDNFLFNLGHPEARRFLTDFISSRIEEYGLGCYRQDFNIDPLPFWHAADAPDRQGMTEIRYIEGLYAFWDGLLERHPGLLIDNCASGGRRIDLETVGRATPFWRTDGPRDAIAHQCHTWGLLPWVPLSATSQDRARDDYEFRSSMCAALCLNWWVSGDVPAEKIPAHFPFDWAEATLRQYLRIRDFYYGDYYPLTSYSQARDQWMAYQLDRPETGRGVVVALRRPESPYETARFPLRGLNGSRSYRVTNLDTGVNAVVPGEQLIAGGLEIALPGQPGSALLLYEAQ